MFASNLQAGENNGQYKFVCCSDVPDITYVEAKKKKDRCHLLLVQHLLLQLLHQLRLLVNLIVLDGGRDESKKQTQEEISNFFSQIWSCSEQKQAPPSAV